MNVTVYHHVIIYPNPRIGEDVRGRQSVSDDPIHAAHLSKHVEWSLVFCFLPQTLVVIHFFLITSKRG